MKRTLIMIVIVTSALQLAVGKSIKIINDEFKKVSLVQLTLEMGADERPRSLLGQIKFIKEIKNNICGPAEINFRLDMSSEFDDVEKKFFIKTDTKQHEMAIKEFSQEKYTKTDRLARSERKLATFKVVIPKELESEILQTGELVIRIYAGTQAGTYTIRKGKLDDVKEFIGITSAK